MACSIGDAPKSRPSSLIAPVAPKHSGSASRFKERAKEILTERVGNIPRLVDEFVAGRIEIF
jgi:hypothetical protein